MDNQSIMHVVSNRMLADTTYDTFERLMDMVSKFKRGEVSHLPLTVTAQVYQTCLDEMDWRRYTKTGQDIGQCWRDEFNGDGV